MIKNQSERFWELLSQFETAMLVSETGEFLTGRPMAIARVDTNCDIWFVSASDTEKIEEILGNPNVVVTCQRDHGCYLSLSGAASVRNDQKILSELWKPSFDHWFPRGKESSNIVLIHVHARRGEYWDKRGKNTLHSLFRSAGSYFSGSRSSDFEQPEHGFVHLDRGSRR